MDNTIGIYGNNVTKRTTVLQSGARKAWIDDNALLKAGLLEEFYFYIDHANDTIQYPMRLQIWRLSTGAFYTLIKDYAVMLNIQQSSVGYLYRVRNFLIV